MLGGGDENRRATDESRLSKRFCVAIVVVGALWGLNWALALLLFDDSGARGTFGDMFGAVNALFSGLAFAGVIYAVLLQKIELEDTRTELRGQKEALQKQNAATACANFERTFFSQLSFHNELVNGLSFRVEKDSNSTKDQITEWYGRDVFSPRARDLEQRLTQAKVGDASALQFAYNDFRNQHGYKRDHYFRSLYNLYKFLDVDAAMPFEEKLRYARVVRAQLSRDELRIIFYNGLTTHGEKFKPLIQGYAVLKHIMHSDILSSALFGGYARSAYGSRADEIKTALQNEEEDPNSPLNIARVMRSDDPS